MSQKGMVVVDNREIASFTEGFPYGMLWQTPTGVSIFYKGEFNY
ncbi:MAG: hypothetical protein WBA93_27190 [Microcoleaceae cyanobacterium]